MVERSFPYSPQLTRFYCAAMGLRVCIKTLAMSESRSNGVFEAQPVGKRQDLAAVMEDQAGTGAEAADARNRRRPRCACGAGEEKFIIIAGGCGLQAGGAILARKGAQR